jgi:hypothetical protein
MRKAEGPGAPAFARPRHPPSAARRDAWLTPEQELLLNAALLPDERALAAWRRLRPAMHPDRLDGPVQAVLPQLHRNLLALGVQDELMPLLKGVHRYVWAQNQLLFAATTPALAALGASDIPTLLLKGAAHVAGDRVDAGMRPMNDLDVLVPTESAPAAIDVLAGAGFVPVADREPWYVARFAPRCIPSHGFRDGNDRQLDLHWHALHTSCQPGADEDFWAAARPVSLRGVATRAMCASDELLHAILHGLRWNDLPTYRWVLDAALIVRSGGVEFDRVVAQARRRRVALPLRTGLRVLERVAGLEVPRSALRALARPAPLQRIELAAEMTRPRDRGALGWAVLYQQQAARRELPLGVRATPLGHARVLRQRRGRPAAALEAALDGPAEGAAQADLDLADSEVVHRHVIDGLWRPDGEARGSWMAGAQARLRLRADDRARLLRVWAGPPLRPAGATLQVSVQGRPLAPMTLHPGRHALDGEGAVVPADVLNGREEVQVALRTRAVAAPTRLGLSDDDRRLGFLLRRVSLAPAAACPPDAEFALGAGSGDEPWLAGGFSDAHDGGRWTVGPSAGVLLDLGVPLAGRELWFESGPVVPELPRLAVAVLINGVEVATLRRDTDLVRTVVTVPPAVAAAGGTQVHLGWRIRRPRSPRSLGLSEDPRPLGLFLRRVGVT